MSVPTSCSNTRLKSVAKRYNCLIGLCDSIETKCLQRVGAGGVEARVGWNEGHPVQADIRMFHGHVQLLGDLVQHHRLLLEDRLQ